MIKPLDDITIHQIAAGEVIERPASVVKELVENSIDAQAKHITVKLIEGGCESIQVLDNGHGIPKDQLALALSPHSTSKIKQFQDIYGVQSFGFRGEALASMVAVSELELLSKADPSEKAYGIKAFEGQYSQPFLATLIQGTSITVQRLFQNVPVRKKQLKRASTEANHILNYIQHIALIYPAIDFELIVDQQLKFTSVGISDRKELLLAKIGMDKADHLHAFEEKFGDSSIEGVFTQPDISFPSRSYQWFSVNNRPCQNPVFRHVIKQVFEVLMPANRHALLLLNLKVPGDTLDVNVHPRKLEFTFFESQALYKMLPLILKNLLRSTQLDHSIFELPVQDSPSPQHSRSPILQSSNSEFSFQGFDFSEISKPIIKAQDTLFNSQQSVATATEHLEPASQQQALALGEVPEHIEFFQLFNTYLVVILPSGMWILDQHAVHEKILYEQLKNLATDQAIQPTLLSNVISLNPQQCDALAQNREALNSLGFKLTLMPGGQVSIDALPALFVGFDLEAWLIQILEMFMEGRSENWGLPSLKEALQMKACKAAIKAGKTLRHAELKQLITDFFKTPDRFTCPHGRPLYKRFDKAALERLFLRA